MLTGSLRARGSLMDANHCPSPRTGWELIEMDLIALLLFLALAVVAFAWLAFADRI